MHNMHCFIFGPTARWTAFRRPRRQPGCTATPRPAGKSADGTRRKPLGGVSARCHAKVPPKDRIFGYTRSSRREDNAMTCGFLEPASGSIRPIDENPILWRDFCSGAGQSRCPAAHPGGRAGQSFTNLSSVPKWRHSASLCAALVKIMHPSASTPAFFECLRATCTRDAPCTRPTRDALLRHTPTPHTAPHRAPRAASRNGPAECNAPPARHCRR